jgi:hypothetical protein
MSKNHDLKIKVSKFNYIIFNTKYHTKKEKKNEKSKTFSLYFSLLLKFTFKNMTVCGITMKSSTIFQFMGLQRSFQNVERISGK